MKRILITGINGFVGTNFTNSWSKNHKLFGVDIRQPEKVGVERTFGWDDMHKLPPVDAIVHLAGKAHDTKNQSVAQSYFDINTDLRRRYLISSCRAMLRRLCFLAR